LVERTHERRWEAEIHRFAGELMLRLHASDTLPDAIACFERALRVAGEQGARALELRATTSLARVWSESGKSVEAHDLLAAVYGRFTEGFDTPDMKQAKVLLDKLASS
jgi:predicted ATPase